MLFELGHDFELVVNELAGLGACRADTAIGRPAVALLALRAKLPDAVIIPRLHRIPILRIAI